MNKLILGAIDAVFIDNQQNGDDATRKLCKITECIRKITYHHCMAERYEIKKRIKCELRFQNAAVIG